MRSHYLRHALPEAHRSLHLPLHRVPTPIRFGIWVCIFRPLITPFVGSQNRSWMSLTQPWCPIARRFPESGNTDSGIFNSISAIFPDFDIPAPYEGAIGLWSRKGASGATVDCYFCTSCGSRLQHKSSHRKNISVKGGCLETLDLTGALHCWCKDAKIDIPKGVERYDGEPPGE